MVPPLFNHSTLSKWWRRLATPLMVASALFFYVQLRSVGNLVSFSTSPKFYDESRKGYDYTSPLALNQNSTMFTDLVGIYHNAESSSIRVIIEDKWTSSDDTVPSRKACLRPYLIGRLSGPAIGMISPWAHLETHVNSTIIEGYYEVPTPGTYFVEIIVILCNTYDEEKLRQASNVTTPGDWTQDAAMQREMQHVVDHCVENPEHHCLTAHNLSIQVTQSSAARNPAESDNKGLPPNRLGGYWEWNASSDQPMEPLYTRYEDLSCIGVPDCTAPAANTTRYTPYQFVWTSNVNLTEQLNATEPISQASTVSRHIVDEESVRALIRLRSQPRVNDTICLIGDSHSRELEEYLTPQLDIPVVQVYTFFANDMGENITAMSRSLSNSSIEDQVNKYLIENSYIYPRKCTIFVIGLGAWVRSLAVKCS
jgi:hypothetical protein